MSDTSKEPLTVDEVVTPSFERLVSSLYTAIMYSLGELKLQGVPETPANLTLARFNLGLLYILREKCRGNLTEEESEFLASMTENAEKAIAAHVYPETKEGDAARS